MFSFPNFFYTILILLRSIRIITNCLSHLKMSKLFSMIHRSQWKHLVYLFGNLSNSGGTNHLLHFCDIPPFDPKILFFVSMLCDVSLLDQYISLLSYFILQSFHFQIGENALFVAAAASEHQPLKRSIHQQFLSRFFPYLYYILCLLNFDLM